VGGATLNATIAAISAIVAVLIMIVLLSLAANKGETPCCLDIILLHSRNNQWPMPPVTPEMLTQMSASYCEIIDLMEVYLMKLAVSNSRLRKL
jgi:hypothetical protein